MKRLLLAIILLSAFLPSMSTRAQSSDDDLATQLSDAGIQWEALVARQFELQGISLNGPMAFIFMTVLFENDGDAKKGMELIPSSFELATESDDAAWVEKGAGNL